MSSAAARERVAQAGGLFDRQIEHEHAIDASFGGARHEVVEAEAIDRVRVGEEHDAAPDVAPDLGDEIERRAPASCRAASARSDAR